MQHEPILGAVIKYLMDKENFTTVFSESMKNVEVNESFLDSFCNGLKLSLLEKIAVSLALSDSENHDARLCGKYEVSTISSNQMLLVCQFLLKFLLTSILLGKQC